MSSAPTSLNFLSDYSHYVNWKYAYLEDRIWEGLFWVYTAEKWAKACKAFVIWSPAVRASSRAPFPVKFSSFKFTGPQGELRRNKDGGDVDYLMLETV